MVALHYWGVAVYPSVWLGASCLVWDVYRAVGRVCPQVQLSCNPFPDFGTFIVRITWS